MRLASVTSVRCFRSHSSCRFVRLLAIAPPRHGPICVGEIARRWLFSSAVATASLQASADNVGSNLSGNKVGSDNTVNTTVNLFNVSLPSIDVSSLHIAREKFRILKDPFTIEHDVVPEGAEEEYLSNITESLKHVLTEGEKFALKQVLVCKSSIRREIDDQSFAPNDAGRTCRVWRFRFH